MLCLSVLINNNFSSPIHIVQQDSQLVSSYLQPIIFVDENFSEKFIDQNNLTNRTYINILVIQ